MILVTCLVSAVWPQAEPQWRQQKIVTFDVPYAGTSAGQGTFAYNIVRRGWISGNYVDAKGVYRGFLRAPDGTITRFDVPGMGTGAGQSVVEVKGMTPSLEIVGSILDANNVYHSFLRTCHGKFAAFDAPGAGTGAYQGTTACWSVICAGGIAPDGTVTGFYADSSNVYHGFVRTSHGKFETFDAPGAGTGAWQGTLPVAINPEGMITGYYTDTNGGLHGFLRLP